MYASGRRRRRHSPHPRQMPRGIARDSRYGRCPAASAESSVLHCRTHGGDRCIHSLRHRPARKGRTRCDESRHIRHRPYRARRSAARMHGDNNRTRRKRHRGRRTGNDGGPGAQAGTAPVGHSIDRQMPVHADMRCGRAALRTIRRRRSVRPSERRHTRSGEIA